MLVFSIGNLGITGGTEPAIAKPALTTIADQLAALGLREP
jgi:TATA-box binding protein (TBP) (component of TFIID and TFIIIB)